ncbi:MAG: polyprenyl diphosphate synthase [Patescibacteria group bacterium]
MATKNKKIPTTIGIIVDGNRRWAKARGLASREGHRAGYNKLKEVLSWARDSGVKNAICYVFSTENWKRSKEEISFLMDLLRSLFMQNEVAEFRKNGISIRVAGDRTMLDPDLQTLISKAEKDTQNENKMILSFALSYGGRKEIVSAINQALIDGKKMITENEFSNYLWTAGVPDPDIIIRTGGERRLSNFLPWQSVYSELFFVDTMWPDFSKGEFTNILEEYAERERRFGK